MSLRSGPKGDFVSKEFLSNFFPDDVVILLILNFCVFFDFAGYASDAAELLIESDCVDFFLRKAERLKK